MPSVLTVTLEQIAAASIDAARIVSLQEVAVREFMLCSFGTGDYAQPLGVAKNSACADLVKFYRLVSKAAGTKIVRPSKAAAFLKILDMPDFCKRMSKLSSRRKFEAHPDSGFLEDMCEALDSLDKVVVDGAAAKFRSGANVSSAVGSALVANKGESASNDNVVGDTSTVAPDDSASHVGCGATDAEEFAVHNSNSHQEKIDTQKVVVAEPKPTPVPTSVPCRQAETPEQFRARMNAEYEDRARRRSETCPRPPEKGKCVTVGSWGMLA